VSPPTVLSRSEHRISRRHIAPEALKVLYRLHRQGFLSYLCGGCVRDLLLGVKPRDFDVVTDAHPQQIRHLFRNSRIIGRRFRLVHVLFTDATIEVATFRRTPESVPDGMDEQEARIWLNNAFGTPAEDAFRRDFTVNGLYYNIADFSVIDHVGGLEDLRAGIIRMIGDPDRRILEDPVRMVRALSLSARLRFRVQPDLFLAILRHKGEIRDTSPSRLLEEFLKIIRSGASAPVFAFLKETGLLPLIFPFLGPVAETPDYDRFLAALGRVDRDIREGRGFEEPVLVGLLYFPAVLAAARDRSASALHQASEAVFAVQTDPFFPKAWRHEMQSLLTAWPKLQAPPQKNRRLADRSYFHDALDFARVVAEGWPETGRHLGQWKTFARGRRKKE
jgi:poly(A) polymerase